jgi:hypothetical protein
VQPWVETKEFNESCGPWSGLRPRTGLRLRFVRSRRFFAEARVFQRRPAGPVEVIRLETEEEDAAPALLEGKIEETYGPVKFVRWWKVGDDAPSGY